MNMHRTVIVEEKRKTEKELMRKRYVSFEHLNLILEKTRNWRVLKRAIPKLHSKNTKVLAQDLLLLAREKSKKSNKLAYMTAHFFFSDISSYFFLLYAYFRRVDDFADSTGLSFEVKQLFLDRQTKLVQELYAGLYSTYKEVGEEFLSSLISFDRSRGSKLEIPILSLLSCINYDVRRADEPPSQEMLDQYIEIEATSCMRMLFYFCCPQTNQTEVITPLVAIAAIWSHLLRDFVLDMSDGLINISKEEKAKFNVDLQDLGSSNFRKWVAYKISDAQSNFVLGKRGLHQHGSLRYKIVVAVYCAKYEYYLYRIKKDLFKLREHYEWNLFEKCIFFIRLLKDILDILVVHFLTAFCPMPKLTARILNVGVS
jgi:phytoene/squalene synthetase